MPLITVIMGVYNCKDYEALSKSINSIIDQTYSDWEFIICNDGSTNDTLHKLNKFAELDKRIKIITYEKNMGLAFALNECIKNAKGDYIARQDDDDISDLSRLECEIKILEKNQDISIVGTLATVFDEDGEWGEYNVPENPEKKDFFWNSPFIHPSVMIRKKDLIDAGCYRNSVETRRCEDYDLFMRMYSLGMRGYNIQSKLYKYKIINNDKKYRPMKYRIDEAKVRIIGYKKMGVLLMGLPFIAKPIMIGLIPQFIFKYIRKNQY